MTMDRSFLEAFIVRAAGADRAAVARLEPLSGGAIQQNFLLDVEIAGGPFAGSLKAVLRTDAPTRLAASLSRAREFQVLKAAHAAGVTVPQPLWRGGGEGNLDFFIMGRVAGTAAGHKLVRDETIAGKALVERIGKEMALIHAIDPAGLDFLESPQPSPALYWVNRLRRFLDEMDPPQPVIEWGLRWLERNAPGPASEKTAKRTEIVLCHHDLRTGNTMVAGGELTGILDWEFAGLGDPMEDLGWYCAKCWRFGADDRQAGGMGRREDFYAAYEKQSGRAIDRQRVFYWEVMAHARWAVIALQQADRFLTGGEESLELALTAHVVPALELEILNMTEREI